MHTNVSHKRVWDFDAQLCAEFEEQFVKD